ncbi:hypothetical protein A4X06_0g2587 [Tilletia controversa]|uniref:Uncharacterized protein n=1 Tax=Tilletia controversa TaxID=13291 RepID=A0A8X7MXE8_9BASI|nr:hypothetical protein CF328_g371 [Tilletia controversa]KAE8251676.1 hypothetical protein A4X06_0g2587 [Tilletia controversa]
MYPNRALPGIKGEGHHIDFWSEEPEQYHTEADLTVRPDEPLETVAVKASKIAEILQAGVYLSAQDEQLGSNSEESSPDAENEARLRFTSQEKIRLRSLEGSGRQTSMHQLGPGPRYVPAEEASIVDDRQALRGTRSDVRPVAKIIGAERNAGGQSLRGRQEYVLAKRLRAHMATRINDIQRWSNQRGTNAILKDVERTMRALYIRIGSLAPAPEEFRKAGWSVEDSLGQFLDQPGPEAVLPVPSACEVGAVIEEELVRYGGKRAREEEEEDDGEEERRPLMVSPDGAAEEEMVIP